MLALSSSPKVGGWVRLIRRAATDSRVVLFAYIAITCLASAHLYLRPPLEYGVDRYAHYNTYMIFKFAFAHLIHGQDLYSAYPDEHLDFFKYSPAFALFSGLFVWLPDMIGLTAWGLLNSLSLLHAVQRMPIRSEAARVAILWFILLELIMSVQGCQSNGLITALLIWTYNHLERGRPGSAALCIILGSFVKIFSLAGFLLFIFYPGKLKGILYALIWAAACAVVPLASVSVEQLLFLYKSWVQLLTNDYSLSVGLSVMGVLQKWFGLNVSKPLAISMGLVMLCLPLLRKEAYRHDQFRMLFLSALLIWVVIFNHKAEPQTFVIAISGVAIWYFSRPTTAVSFALACFAFVLTTVSHTDLFPRFLRNEFVVPYRLMVAPCILVWCRAIYELSFFSTIREPHECKAIQPL